MVSTDIPHVAKYLLEKHGLAEKGWTFQWDNAKRRAGRCTYATRTISLSRHYVELNIANGFDDIVDTILHEIAHALTPGHGHDKVWKMACQQVGARPQRCYDADVVTMPQGKYVAKCGGCGREFRRHKPVKRYSWRYCLACGPEVGRLTYQDTSAIPVVETHTTPPTPRKLRS